MGYVEAGTIIHAPIHTVWDCLNAIDHTPEWVVGLAAAEIVTSGPYGEGSVYHDHNRLGPFLQTTPWTVTTFQALSCQVHESESATLPSKMTLNLTPDPEGTYLEMIVEYRLLPRLGVVSRLLEQGLMNRMLKQVLTQNQAHLDAYLTQQVGLNLQPAGN